MLHLIRTVDFDADRRFKNLTHAEDTLIKNCCNGSDTIISKERPEEGSPDNTIRAGLIQALLLGTGERTPPGPRAGDQGSVDH